MLSRQNAFCKILMFSSPKKFCFLNRFRLCDFVFREGYLILKAVSLGRKMSIQLRLLRSEREFFSPVFGRYRMCR